MQGGASGEDLALRVVQALQAEIDRLGFADPVPQVAALDQASRRVVRDPASGEDGIDYEWRDGRGYRIGGLVMHADGSFFAEFDVIRPHPARAQMFVEAVTAWGRGEQIKSEARLLTNPD